MTPATGLSAAPAIEATLSLLEADVLGEALGIDAWPWPLLVPSHGSTIDERRALTRSTWTRLQARGLVAGEVRDGRVDDELAADLRVLARPSVALDCVYHPGGSGSLVQGLVAATDRRAVAAVLLVDGLHLHPCRPTGLAHEVVALLPPAPAGPGPSITLPTAALDAAAEAERRHGTRAAVDAMTRAGVSNADTSALRAVFDHRQRGGQIGCTRAADAVTGGAPVRSPELISWVDTPQGRYMTVLSTGADPTLSLAPADATRLARRIGELVDAG